MPMCPLFQLDERNPMRSESRSTPCAHAIAQMTSALRAAARHGVGLALLALPFALPASESARPPERAEASVLSTELVRPGLYRIDGGGGASLVRVSSKGLVVVDAKRAGMYEPLMAELRRIARSPNPPILALILTGAGRDQAGTVARFVEAGVAVIVQRHAVVALDRGPLTQTGRPASDSFITYDTDYQLFASDAVVEVEHVGSGRSRADSVVLFPDLRVAALGELFVAATPEPECAAGGSLAGWSAEIDHVMWIPFDIAVPSRGASVGKSELTALKGRLDAVAGGTSTASACPVAAVLR